MIKINEVKITPGTANVNQAIKIEVLVQEANWGNVKNELTNWNKVNSMKNWQELKDY